MPLGVGIGQVVGLVREMRGLEGATASIAVAGDGAAELAAALAAGGDAAAVRVGGDPSQRRRRDPACSTAQPSAAEAAVLRELSRAGVGLVVVQRGTGRVPHVLPGDVIEAEAGRAAAARRILTAIARAAGDDGPALAARLPVLRPAVARRLIMTTALANAAVAASSKLQKAQLPVLTLAQSRMVLLLGAQPRRRPPARPAAARDHGRTCHCRLHRHGLRRPHASCAGFLPRPGRPGRSGLRRHPGARRRPPPPASRRTSSWGSPSGPGPEDRFDPDEAKGVPVPEIELAEELLQIEEADAWFEYLEATRVQSETRYAEVEPWAWARLNQRLRAVRARRARLRPAAA